MTQTTTRRPLATGSRTPGPRPSAPPAPIAPEPADVAAEQAYADRVAALFDGPPGAEPVLAVLNGPVGCGVTGILRRATTAAGVTSGWVHVLPGRSDGAQGAMAQWTRADGTGEQGTTAGPSLADVLDELSGELPPGSVLVVDSFHSLTMASANSLIVWSHAARLRGVHVLIGFHPALDQAGVAPLLNVPSTTTWIDVRPLREEELRADLAAGLPWAAPGLLDVAVDACAGSSLLLRALRRALAGEESVDANALSRAHASALESGTLRLVADQGPDALTLGLLSALVRPVHSARAAAEQLGLPGATAARLEVLLTECGLQPNTRESAGVVHSVLARSAPMDVRRVAAGHAHSLLSASAGKGQLFRLRATVGDSLTGMLPLAEAAYAEAWAEGDPDTAAAVATTMLTRSADPAELAWAKAAAMRCWAGIDWNAFATHVAWLDEPAVAPLVADLDLCDWLRLEAHTVAREVFGISGAGELRQATRLANRALYGYAAEPDVKNLDQAISGQGILSVSAPLASRLALAWFGLADYEAAHRWASVAAFTASESELADCAMGHLVGAQALIRLGHFDQAEQQAQAGAELFAAFGASNLEAFARLSAIHAAVEARRPVTALPDPVANPHPGLALYRTYLAARCDLLAGRADQAVRQLFECGRALTKCGVVNPSLVNWRPHLASIFRAKGQADFGQHVETDLVAAWREWAAIEPAAAARRGTVLGARAAEVFTDDEQPVSAPTLDMLSPAELRVVDLVVKGMSNRDAAKTLFLSKRTVDTHLGNVYRKLSLGSREDLVELMKVLAPQRGECALSVFG